MTQYEYTQHVTNRTNDEENRMNIYKKKTQQHMRESARRLMFGKSGKVMVFGGLALAR